MKSIFIRSALIASLLVFSNSYAFATDETSEFQKKIDNLKSEIEKSNNSQNNLKDSLQKNNSHIVETKKGISELQKEIDNNEFNIIRSEQQIFSLESTISKTEKEIILINKELTYQKKILGQTISFLFEYGNISFIEFLFQNKNLEELYNTQEFIKIMMNENKKSYDNIQTNQKKLVENKQKLVISRLSLKDKLNSLVALQNDTIGKKNILNTYLNEKEIEQLALFDSIKKEQFFEESASNEIILILDQLEYLKQLQSSESSTFVFDKIEYDFISSTSLQTPMPSYQISSDYGMRFHPVLQYSRMHNGVDLGGLFGEPIYSAGDGVVVFAGPASGFGNWIVLYHGTINDKEIFTIYGHMNADQIFVKSNQPVKKGEKIAGIGSAGTSTGPHLHFGLAEGYSGSSFNYVDPKKYIKFSPNQPIQVQPVIPKIELKPVITEPVEPITTPVIDKEEPSDSE